MKCGTTMSLRLSSQKYGACFFITTSFVEHLPFGNRSGVYEALADSLIFYMAKYRAKLPAYVFMPTHVHILLLLDGKQLAGFMRDFKKYLAQESLKQIHPKDTSLWEPGYDRQAVFSENVFRVKMDYIHNNPIKAGLVMSADKWKWSSAGDYLTGRPGLIPVWKKWLF